MDEKERIELEKRIDELAKKYESEETDKDVPKVYFLTKAADEILFKRDRESKNARPLDSYSPPISFFDS